VELHNTHHALRSCWHPVALTEELSAGPLAVQLLGERWVVVRLDGQARVFRDQCPHRRAPLSAGSVVDDRLHCAYHGWQFGSSGTCVLIPALGPGATIPSRARLDAAAHVREHLGMVWLALDEPVTPLLDVPEWEAEGMATAALTPTVGAVSAGSMMDNFCDAAHFPFVHAGTFGSGESPETGTPAVTRSGWTVEGVDVQSFSNHEDPAVARGERPLVQTRTATYRWTAPFAASLRLEYEGGGTNVIVFAVQPVDDTTCRIYTIMLRNDLPDPGALSDAIAYEQAVLEEDLRIQERMPSTFPLDVTSEVHTRADRLTVEIRRVLAELVGSPAG
jgi:phenylpropionate dioxygenase-like ring-hydroxylating dioxygenase large terminal subunit